MPDRDNFQPYDYTRERVESQDTPLTTWNGDSPGADEGMSDEAWAARCAARPSREERDEMAAWVEARRARMDGAA